MKEVHYLVHAEPYILALYRIRDSFESQEHVWTAIKAQVWREVGHPFVYVMARDQLKESAKEEMK